MDKIEKIRQEIKRLRQEIKDEKDPLALNQKAGYLFALTDMESFLDTLSEEPDKSLEKASYDAVCRIFGCDPMYFGNKAEITARECDYLFRAGVEWRDSQLPKLPDKSLEEEISRTYHDGSVTDTEDIDHVAYENIARHFAEWQASQMPMPEDTVLFQKGVAEGRRLEREDMLKEAVEADVKLTLHDKTGDISLYTGYLPKEFGIKYGDNVKVIVIKAGEE